ncbi:MAG: ParA family protein [Microthrixaceae bacterium]|nr:ParA family protein [Microthrixaceae bacterium]
MTVTAIVNQKGGVGKTTVTLGLAATLAAYGRRVLVVDLDPQANATTGAGVWDAKSTIADVLANEQPGGVARVITPAGWPTGAESDDAQIRSVETIPSGSVDVAPSGPNLARVEHDLASDMIGGQDRLAVSLDGVAHNYDHVLIDCAPSLGLLTVNALFAADDVVVVAEPAAWSLDGVEQIVQNVERVAGRRGGRPVIRGIAVNKLARTRDSAHWYHQLQETHAARRIGAPIRLRAAVAESAAHCLPITAMTRSGASEVVEEFTELAKGFGLLDRDEPDQQIDSEPSPNPPNVHSVAFGGESDPTPVG